MRLRKLGLGAAPSDLLAAVGTQPLFAVASELLGLAERYYASSRAGIRFLPFRAAIAIAAARGIYREIGRRILRARVPEATESTDGGAEARDAVARRARASYRDVEPVGAAPTTEPTAALVTRLTPRPDAPKAAATTARRDDCDVRGADRKWKQVSSDNSQG